MAGIVEMLEAADLLLTWIVGALMGGLGLFWWLDGRSQRLVDGKIAAALPDPEVAADLARDVERLGTRLHAMELRVAALPTAQEVNELKVAMAAVAAQLRSTAEQVDTLYRAALAADRGGK